VCVLAASLLRSFIRGGGFSFVSFGSCVHGVSFYVYGY